MTYDITEAKRLADAACRVQRAWQRHCDAVTATNAAIPQLEAERWERERYLDLYRKSEQARRDWFKAAQDFVMADEAKKAAASLRDAVADIERLREFVRRVESLSNDGFLARDARAMIQAVDNG